MHHDALERVWRVLVVGCMPCDDVVAPCSDVVVMVYRLPFDAWGCVAAGHVWLLGMCAKWASRPT